MRRVIAGVLAAAWLLVACGGGGDDEPAAQAPTTVTTAAAGCPALAGAAGTTDATNAAGDFDGDARPDRLLAYRVSAGGPWRIRAELAAGGGAEADLPATAEAVKAVGGARLDVGPADAAFAVVGRGATGVNIGIFVLRGCRLERVTSGGRAAEFPVGSTSTSRTGLACQALGIVAYQATTTDGRFYQASTVSYLLSGLVADEVHRANMSLPADDPALPSYGALSCGSLRL